MIVAIDGPAGSGKSTIASALAKRFGFEKLDSGAMYRAVAFTAQDRGIDLDDEEAVTALASTVTIRFAPGEGMSRITVDDRDVSREIRTPAVDATVSKVAA
ncbi:d(CMP) kinase, partial [uncultured Enorma sp.]|uniref:(d)CMP kinase n=1 Tax=uncultured Enorma sp. TaxID=1714346 RepID=UPI0025FF1F11